MKWVTCERLLMYFAAVVNNWRPHSSEIQIQIDFKFDSLTYLAYSNWSIKFKILVLNSDWLVSPTNEIDNLSPSHMKDDRSCQF